ncbi:MAG TPA: hypothetical protein DIV79_11010 [Opitutae bacterium]|nr:hypothetical protein [Opitutae bacterium]
MITLFLSGFFLLAISLDKERISLTKIVSGGIFLALAALARPHFFAVLLTLCGLSLGAVLLLRQYRIAALAFLAICMSCLAIYGAVQMAHSGTFAIMPTQGGFNLWKSNHSQANGLYLQQSLKFHYNGEHKNPSRMESEILYQQDTMLLADAASRVGQDEEAFFWSEESLALNPNRQDARRLRLLAFYNLVATGDEISTGKRWNDFKEDLESLSLDDPYLDFVRGVAYWNLNDLPAATETWLSSFTKHGWNASSSLAALLHTNASAPHKLPSFQSSSLPPNALLIYALNQSNRQPLRESIGFHFPQSKDFYLAVEQSLNRVLPIPDNQG